MNSGVVPIDRQEAARERLKREREEGVAEGVAQGRAEFAAYLAAAVQEAEARLRAAHDRDEARLINQGVLQARHGRWVGFALGLALGVVIACGASLGTYALVRSAWYDNAGARALEQRGQWEPPALTICDPGDRACQRRSHRPPSGQDGWARGREPDSAR